MKYYFTALAPKYLMQLKIHDLAPKYLVQLKTKFSWFSRIRCHINVRYKINATPVREASGQTIDLHLSFCSSKSNSLLLSLDLQQNTWCSLVSPLAPISCAPHRSFPPNFPPHCIVPASNSRGMEGEEDLQLAYLLPLSVVCGNTVLYSHLQV